MTHNTKQYTIDAEGQKLGRIASRAASILMGKNTVSFSRNRAPVARVEIVNASKLSISHKRRADKKYARFSGYQGGLRFETLGALLARRGWDEVVRHAVRGMIPKNKLRPGMLKRLRVSD